MDIDTLRLMIRDAENNELHATHNGKRYQLQRGIFGNPDLYVFVSLDDVKKPGMYFFESDTWSCGNTLTTCKENTVRQFLIDITELEWS